MQLPGKAADVAPLASERGDTSLFAVSAASRAGNSTATVAGRSSRRHIRDHGSRCRPARGPGP